MSRNAPCDNFHYAYCFALRLALLASAWLALASTGALRRGAGLAPAWDPELELATAAPADAAAGALGGSLTPCGKSPCTGQAVQGNPLSSRCRSHKNRMALRAASSQPCKLHAKLLRGHGG